MFAGCLDLTLSILTQFTLEIYAAATNRKKTLKPLFQKFKVIQGHRCLHQ